MDMKTVNGALDNLKLRFEKKAQAMSHKGEVSTAWALAAKSVGQLKKDLN